MFSTFLDKWAQLLALALAQSSLVLGTSSQNRVCGPSPRKNWAGASAGRTAAAFIFFGLLSWSLLLLFLSRLLLLQVKHRRRFNSSSYCCFPLFLFRYNRSSYNL